MMPLRSTSWTIERSFDKAEDVKRIGGLLSNKLEMRPSA